jgi:hypothetical protein
MPVKFDFKGIDSLAASLSSLPLRMLGGVKIQGEVNFIKAMVWDLGYVTRVIKPGPKTMWSMNVFDEPKVLTITAPTGFIRVNRDRYVTIARSELQKADFANTPVTGWPTLINEALSSAAEQLAEIVREAAPVDTGAMRDSIMPAYPDDPVLQATPSADWETFSVGGFLV